MQEGKLKSLKDLETEARIKAEVEQENIKVKTEAEKIKKEKKKIGKAKKSK